MAANATSAVAVFPGYLGAVAGFRREIRRIEPALLGWYCAASLAGGFGGALLLLITSNQVFSMLIPWLLLFATLLFGFGESLLVRLGRRTLLTRAKGCGILFVVALYGGYFNGGLGIILLAALLFIGLTDLNVMNGLKNGISFVIACISVITFAAAGIVHWRVGLVMMIAATCGGYVGAVVARRIPSGLLKYMITIIGLLMTIIFFIRS